MDIIPVSLHGDRLYMKFILPGILVFAILSCTELGKDFVENSCSEEDKQTETQEGSHNGNDEVNPGTDSGCGGTVYVTGVEYPRGYDWAASIEPEGTEALIFLMSGGKRILDFLAGDQHCVYADPSRHRCIDGHIYSDFNTDGKTIVKKDGETMFVYDTEEVVVSWAVTGGDVFTLAEKKPQGVSLRKNGNSIYENISGRVLSGLYMDGGSVGFCAGLSTPGKCSFDIYSDGAVDRRLCPEKLDSVLVAESFSGRLAYVGYSSASDEYILFYDGRETVLERFRYDYIAEMRFLRGKDKFFVYGELSDENDNLCSPAVWTIDGLLFNFSVYDKSFSVCTDADTVYTFVGKQQYPQKISAYMNGTDKIFEYGSGLSVYSDNASVVADGKLYFIYQKNIPYLRPCISVDGVETEYGFNGFFSGVSRY